MLSLSILSRVQQESFYFFFSKDCLVMVGTYSRLHFGQRGFPLHFILFGRIYIYGGMAPSFDFVVVIGIFCLSHKASKFEQWWPNILEPCDFTSLVGGQRLCLHQCLWQYVRLFLKKIMQQLAYLWINNMPCWLSINWIRLSKLSVNFCSHAAVMETRWWEKTRFPLPSVSLSSRQLVLRRACLC